MIEDLEMIIPLLDGLKDGAITAFVVFMGVQYIQAILPYVTWVMVVLVVCKAGASMFSRYVSSKTGADDLELYYTDCGGDYVFLNNGVFDTFMEFMKDHVRKGDLSFIHESDMQELKDAYINRNRGE